MKYCVLLAALPLLGGCSVAAAQTDSVPGRLVIVGGGLSRDNEAIYRSVIDARHDGGPVCIVPTASGGDPQQTITGAVASFERWGGAGVARGIDLSIANAAAATDTAVARTITECGGFWFTGGVQSRVSTVFRPDGGSTPAYEALRARHRTGAVVGGSSAGAAIMSDPMIAAGSTSGALVHGVTRIPAEADEDDDADPVAGVAISTGLGFLPNAIVDQHFLARGRIGRLLAAVTELNEYDLGFGIDENTALVVDGHMARAVGASGVIVIDASNVRRIGPRAFSGIELHLLGDGDAFDMRTRTFQAAETKTPLAAADTIVTLPDNVFARWAFLHLLRDFATSTHVFVEVRIEGASLTLIKTHDFAARSLPGIGVQDAPAGLSITGLRVDIRRPRRTH